MPSGFISTFPVSPKAREGRQGKSYNRPWMNRSVRMEAVQSNFSKTRNGCTFNEASRTTRVDTVGFFAASETLFSNAPKPIRESIPPGAVLYLLASEMFLTAAAVVGRGYSVLGFVRSTYKIEPRGLDILRFSNPWCGDCSSEKLEGSDTFEDLSSRLVLAIGSRLGCPFCRCFQ